MAAQRHGTNFKLLRSHGRAGNASSWSPVAGSFGGFCICDLSSWRMARLAAVDPGGIRSEENAGRGCDFPAERIRGEATEHGAGFLDRRLGRVSHLQNEPRANVSLAQGRSG